MHRMKVSKQRIALQTQDSENDILLPKRKQETGHRLKLFAVELAHPVGMKPNAEVFSDSRT